MIPEAGSPARSRYSGPMIALITLVGVAAIALALGHALANKTLEWTEEVRLSDGEVLVVKRAERWRFQLGLGDHMGWTGPYERRLRVVRGPDAVLGATYAGGSLPVAMERVNREDFLITLGSRYQCYVARQSRFMESPCKPISGFVTQSNLMSPTPNNPLSSHITLAEKRQAMREALADRLNPGLNIDHRYFQD